MLSLKERDRLANSSDEIKRTIDIVWTAYRSILSQEGSLAYVSTAITSGRRMYDLLDKMGLAEPDELKTKEPHIFFDRIIKPNIEEGTLLAKDIAKQIGNPVVAPSIFEAKKQRWSQDEYMAMWLRMIEENVGKMYMAPEWEYSGGGAEEYLHAVQMIFGFKQRWNIEIFDAHGKPLFFHDGLSILTRALADLKQRKRKAKTLEEVIHGLRNLWQVQFCPEISHELPKVWNQNFLDKADKHVVDDVIKYIDKNFELNYDKTIFLDSGLPPRRNLPENIILKAEDPPA